MGEYWNMPGVDLRILFYFTFVRILFSSIIFILFHFIPVSPAVTPTFPLLSLIYIFYPTVPTSLSRTHRTD